MSKHLYLLFTDCDDHYRQLGVFERLSDIITRCHALDGSDVSGNGGPLVGDDDDYETLYVGRIEVGKLSPDGFPDQIEVVIKRKWELGDDGELIWSTKVTTMKEVGDPSRPTQDQEVGQ